MQVLSVDVIVPCYRYGHFLEECVASVLTQDGVEARVLIIDDTSPDNTQEVGLALASMDTRITYRRHAVNLGHIETYNEGIEWASADCVLLLSADDYLLPQALGRACRLMEDRPEIGFVFGNAVVLHADGVTEACLPLGPHAEPAFLVMTGRDFVRRSGASNIVPTPTAVVRTDLQKWAGGYRAELPHSGDMEMWLRLASHAAVGFINENQGVYRRHDANMSLAYSAEHRFMDLKERRKALDAFFAYAAGSPAADPKLQRELLAGLARDAIGRASAAFNDGDLDAADAIRQFALDVSPGARKSWAWVKLACKRLMGPATWRVMGLARAGLLRRL